MNKENRENFLEVKEEKIIEKQKKVRSRNRTYTRNNSFISVNTNLI